MMMLAKENRVIKFPRAIKSVRDLLERVLKQSETIKLKQCVIITVDEEGRLFIMHTPGKTSQIIGLMEMAKLNFWEDC